jgi:hypothetical protein
VGQRFLRLDRLTSWFGNSVHTENKLSCSDDAPEKTLDYEICSIGRAQIGRGLQYINKQLRNLEMYKENIEVTCHQT